MASAADRHDGPSAANQLARTSAAAPPETAADERRFRSISVASPMVRNSGRSPGVEKRPTNSRNIARCERWSNSNLRGTQSEQAC
eukprot:scaffold62234_cov32-Tisochrysis_lutea.AAC.2